MNLNHPFYVYPRGIMSEYNNYFKYREEVVRLYQFMSKLHYDITNGKYSDTKLLIPIILGSTMEDSIQKSYSPITNFFQHRQLFPNYIGNFIKTFDQEKKHIQIIIISPDNLFDSDTYIPLFIKYNQQYAFNKINLYEFEMIGMYNDESLNGYEQIPGLSIKINIFNCPFPSIDKRSLIIDKCDNLIKEMRINDFGIETYKQSDHDISFISDFYQLIDNIFALNNYKEIFVIVNSFVSFKNLDGHSENYNMFKELLILCNKFNIIATEWSYVDELMCYKIVSSYHFKNKIYAGGYIEYVTDNDFLRLDMIENNILEKNTLDTRFCQVFQINFYETDLLERFVFDVPSKIVDCI
jgi:hypothetical protein